MYGLMYKAEHAPPLPKQKMGPLVEPIFVFANARPGFLPEWKQVQAEAPRRGSAG